MAASQQQSSIFSGSALVALALGGGGDTDHRAVKGVAPHGAVEGASPKAKMPPSEATSQ